MATHPDRIYQETILSIILRGAKLGYCGPKQRIISGNLPSATNDPDTLTADLKNQIAEDRLTEVNEIGDHFICSPLGLAPKSNGKWRRIHHLSYPRGRSVNCHIPKEWGALEYTTFDEAKQEVIRAGPGAIMVKRDLKDAFRHIPVSPQDWWLLGFSWDNKTWIDRFLPFGLRTSPFLFDLFAKGIHWIMAVVLLWGLIFHYLDDFFAVFKKLQQAQQFGKEFDNVCVDLGVGVNGEKKQLGCIVDFLGLEFDTLLMEARLPKDKLIKAIEGVARILEKKSSTTHKELQSLVGLLSFAAKVVYPGQAFLRRLYNGLAKGRKYLHWSILIRDDLLWWEKFLLQ